MKFAYVNNIKSEAKPNLIGKCIVCGNDVRSYCGGQIIHHWKHINLFNCDSWYERETEWHKNWKNYFDKSYQEIVKFDKILDEKHIADIYLPHKDLVIEFQHSPIEIKEIKAREDFYNKMLWVIDLTQTKNIEIFKTKNELNILFNKMKTKLPQEFKVDNEFKHEHSTNNEVIIFLENQGLKRENIISNLYISELEKKYHVLCEKSDYYIITWKYLQKRWIISEKPKFIDLGNDYIYPLC